MAFPDPPKKQLLFIVGLLLLCLPVLLGIPQWLGKRAAGPERLALENACEISYSTFKALIGQGVLDKVIFWDDQIEGFLRHPQHFDCYGGQPSEHVKTNSPQFDDPSFLAQLEEQKVEIHITHTEQYREWSSFFLALLPGLFLIALFYWYYRWAVHKTRGVGVLKSGHTFHRLGDPQAKIPDISFKDVAGQESVKREVTELVDFLSNPVKFQQLGAEIPRGVLLMGPPGTGKTLMARALAGEAKVPFYTVSASEFVEIYVGVGALRVRDLFETAKKHTPCIIFIDELDSVGRMRGVGIGGGSDEREQTLNQILAEMDGFSGHEAVIVLAATNRPDVLDPALLRPGRFDRHVTMDLPERQDRVNILRIHTVQVPLDEEVDLDMIAGETPGFSGADLKNLVNEAAILAAQKGATKVTIKDFEQVRDKLLLGTIRTMAIMPKEKYRMAVHEAGHVLTSYFQPNTDPLFKVSIIPRGRSLGGTEQVPVEERHTLPEEYLSDRLVVMLGGRVAEKEVLGSYSSGAEDDIRQATALARSMAACWGMSQEIGPIDLCVSEKHPYLGGEHARQRLNSENSAQVVDKAVSKILFEAEKQATDLIRHHLKALDSLVANLQEKEILYKEDIIACIEKQSVNK